MASQTGSSAVSSSVSACNSSTIQSSNIHESSKFDIEQLIKDYNPEEGFSKFVADQVKLQMRTPKGVQAPSVSPVKSKKSVNKTAPCGTLEKKHRYFQHPGQQHNRDRCDACLGIGSIICCDKCPASFHLKCFDPPIDEENLGQTWLCRECSSDDITVDSVQINFPFAIVESEKVAADDDFSHNQNADNVEEGQTKKKRNRTISEGSKVASLYDAVKSGRNRKRKKANDDESASDLVDCKKLKTDIEIKVVDSGLLQALKALKVQCLRANPKEFWLPNSYSTQEPLIGSSFYNQRIRQIEFGKLPRSEMKQPIVVDGEGCVPTNPIRLCYECAKSCLKSPLVACDYCPAAFHMECLDPPMTALPQGRWMCPLHPHHFNPRLLLHRSWTTRVEFHEQFSERLDEEHVKRMFHLNINKQYPPWIDCVNRRTLERRPQLEVPQSVKDMYRNPVCDNLKPISRISDTNFDEILTDGENKLLTETLIDLLLRTRKPDEFDERVSCEEETPKEPTLEEIEKAIESLTDMELKNANRSIAVLFHMHSRKLFFMNKTCVLVGTDAERCDVLLSARCCNVSGIHAVIFYEAKEEKFEILNYSQHGLIVDGIRLGTQANNKKSVLSNVAKDEFDSSQSSLIDSIRKFNSSCHSNESSKSALLAKINSLKNSNKPAACSCSNERDFLIGWEGSVFLKHGSVLSFGCIPLVFSVL